MTELREWQERALDYFETHNKCIIEAATGTGKSFLTVNIILSVLDKNPKTTILVIVPKNVILEDTWFRELCDKISVRNIGVFYGEIKEKAQITLTNIQSIEKVGYDDYDFVIWDELHNAYSDRLLYFLHKEKRYKLGLTATLGRKDLKHWDALKCFDFNLFRYGMHEAVEDGVLNRFRLHNVVLEMESEDRKKYDEISDKLKQYSEMRNNGVWSKELQMARYKLLDARKRLLGKSLKKLTFFEKFKSDLLGRKIIVFNEYNDIAPQCYWEMIDHGFKPCIFNTDIEKLRRYDNLKMYRNDTFDTIITTRALDEGYNLPKIDVAVILCGGSSSRQMIQRAGRVLRKKKSTTDIYQVFFKNTIEEEYAMQRYEIVRSSCESCEVLEI